TFVREGRIYEVLAKAVLETPFVVPKDMNAKMKGLDKDSKEDIRVQVEDQIRQVLDQKVRPIECYAIARYVLAARAARVASFDDTYSQLSIDRLQAYGDERIAECVEETRKRDAGFASYTAGEFTRAPRGQPLALPRGSSMPSAAGEALP